jgi:hypothetical protein
VFEDDGCTFWLDRTWRACCDIHDAAFASGTTLQQFWDANVALLECVAPFDPIAAALMFVGCMTGGALFFFFGRKRRE